MLVLQTEDAADVGFPRNTQFLLHVIDNGNPVMGTPPDFIRNSGAEDFLPAPLSTLMGFPCGMPTGPPGQLQKGNITVRDVS
jgi:hypothetical protein